MRILTGCAALFLASTSEETASTEPRRCAGLRLRWSTEDADGAGKGALSPPHLPAVKDAAAISSVSPL